VFRTERGRNPKNWTKLSVDRPLDGRGSITTIGIVLDPGFGPFFLKFCSYFPHNAKK